MERLPYIDEYAIRIDADRATTWRALLKRMCRNPQDPTTVPFGFALDEAVEGERFALRGHHWFARYRLTFLLADRDNGTQLSAETRAAFPGLKGRVYRALVLGTGGHVVVVRRMLNRIAAQAMEAPNMTTP